MTGDFTGMFSGGGTIFTFTTASHGIRTADEAAYFSINGFQIRGVAATPGSGKHGLKVTRQILAENLYINGFERAIDCYGNSGATPYSNTNGSGFRNIAIQDCIWGTWSDGPDANNMTFDRVSCISNRLGGHMDSSFLGNIYCEGDLSTNGGYDGTYKSRCESGGHIYMVAQYQETWCSTNAPTGAATSNQGWLYVGDAAAVPAYQPTWTTGQTWYFSAPFAMDSNNNNARSVFRDIYIEPDQNPAIMTWPGICYVGSDTGSILTPTGLGYSGVIRAGYNGVIQTGDISAKTLACKDLNAYSSDGAQIVLGVDSAQGTVAVGGTISPGRDTNQELAIRSWGAAAYTTLAFYQNTTAKASLQYYQDGTIYYSAPTAHYFYVSGSPSARLAANGYDLKVGAYMVNGTSVIDASRNGSFADLAATGTVTATGAVTGSNLSGTNSGDQFTSTTAARLLGRGSAAGAGAAQELTLAGGLAMSGTALTAAGALTPTSLASTGEVSSSSASAGIGYATGAGGTVTQATSKSTGVTLNKTCGRVTTSSAALAAAAIVEFTMTNSAVAASDTINLNLASGAATTTAYRYWVSAVAAGSFKVCVENRSGGSLSEALAFNIAVVKAVNA